MLFSAMAPARLRVAPERSGSSCAVARAVFVPPTRSGEARPVKPQTGAVAPRLLPRCPVEPSRPRTIPCGPGRVCVCGVCWLRGLAGQAT